MLEDELKEIEEAMVRLKKLEENTTLWCVVGVGMFRIPKDASIAKMVKAGVS